MNNENLRLSELLRDKHLTIATSESCTAGGIGAAIASVDGASEYFVGGVIAYTAEMKHNVLGVPYETIRDYGIVSQQVAEMMNNGVRKLTNADVAISITGYAGKSGGDEFVENGTVWICVGMSDEQVQSTCLHVASGRAENLSRAIREAISLACQFVEKMPL